MSIVLHLLSRSLISPFNLKQACLDDIYKFWDLALNLHILIERDFLFKHYLNHIFDSCHRIVSKLRHRLYELYHLAFFSSLHFPIAIEVFFSIKGAKVCLCEAFDSDIRFINIILPCLQILEDKIIESLPNSDCMALDKPFSVLEDLNLIQILLILLSKWHILLLIKDKLLRYLDLLFLNLSSNLLVILNQILCPTLIRPRYSIVLNLLISCCFLSLPLFKFHSLDSHDLEIKG